MAASSAISEDASFCRAATSFADRFNAAAGDIFRLSKILGHSSVAVTEKLYAHLKADAHAGDSHAGDYGRVTFEMPGDVPAHREAAVLCRRPRPAALHGSRDL